MTPRTVFIWQAQYGVDDTWYDQDADDDGYGAAVVHRTEAAARAAGHGGRGRWQLVSRTFTDTIIIEAPEWETPA